MTGNILIKTRHLKITATLEPVVYEELDLAGPRHLGVSPPQLDLEDSGHEKGERHEEGACHDPLQWRGQQSKLAWYNIVMGFVNTDPFTSLPRPG